MRLKLPFAAICSAFAVLNAKAITTHFVDLNCPNPVAPYTSWTTAATNIQDAIDVAGNADTVLVTNGVYATGGRKWFDSGMNRVTITNSLLVQSVNGPTVTFIEGRHASGTNAVRCVLMTMNAVIAGFTLTNGQSGIGNYPTGGGIYGSLLSIASNCVIVGNLANDSGGGAYRGMLVNCILKNNSATDGGGGAYGASLTNCVVSGNSANNGGGTYNIVAADNCLIVSNTASISGGGSYGGMFFNCTWVGNTAVSSGGGVYGGTGAWLYNSIVFFNSASTDANVTGTKYNYTCAPAILGGNNITNNPAFVDISTGNFNLKSISPCINAGNNAYVFSSTDLGGNPRIVTSTVDMGAYEFQFQNSLNFYAFLKSPADNSSNIVINWQSINGVKYFIQRSSNLGTQPAFSSVQSNLIGQAGMTTYTDLTATGSGPYFYRVGVQ